MAWEAAERLTSSWGTTLHAPRTMIGAMVTVPLPQAAGSTTDEAMRLRLQMPVDDHIEVPIHPWHGRLWTRVSAQSAFLLRIRNTAVALLLRAVRRSRLRFERERERSELHFFPRLVAPMHVDV